MNTDLLMEQRLRQLTIDELYEAMSFSDDFNNDGIYSSEHIKGINSGYAVNELCRRAGLYDKIQKASSPRSSYDDFGRKVLRIIHNNPKGFMDYTNYD